MNATKTYLCLDQIGRGSYASVHRAIDTRTGEICAIKKIKTPTLNYQHIKNEISIMCECKCESIVRLLGSEYIEKEEVWLVMEYCPGGSVKDAMRELDRTINEEEIIVILKGVLTGLEYLHANEKIHRDVKAANILLNEDGLAKLGDFGVSEPLDSSTRNRPIIGTLLWLAPEVLRQENYSQVLDVWSLGITIIEMGEGQPPYSEMGERDALDTIANLNISAPTFRDSSKWSAGLIDFLGLCLEKDASSRRSAQKLLQHDIIKNSPPNDVLKKVVTEVCSTSKSTETRLTRRLECLFVESEVLRCAYRDSFREVREVDQLTQKLGEDKVSFEKLDVNMRERDAKISEIRTHLKSLSNEITKLERERNDLSSTLKNQDSRKKDILIQLNKIRDQQRRLEGEIDERERRKFSNLQKTFA